MQTVTLRRVAAATPEDQARSQWYLFIARVMRDAPDEALLASLRASPATGHDGRTGASENSTPPLEQAWSDLVDAARSHDAASLRVEYDQAFVGVGRPEIILNASWHLTGFLNDRPLADLRELLATLGITRRDDIGETEDHVSALCEVMAWLIVSEDPRLADLATQRALFQRFLAPWYPNLCDSLEQSPSTAFYRVVGRLLRAFLDVERLAFDFES